MAYAFYGNRALAGRIAELNRDENGNIRAIQNDRIIIPDPTAIRSTEYYTYYFNVVLQYSYHLCPSSSGQNVFPCVYQVPLNTSLHSLATDMYPDVSSRDLELLLDTLEAANDTHYYELTYDLIPYTDIPAGTFIILPKY